MQQIQKCIILMVAVYISTCFIDRPSTAAEIEIPVLMYHHFSETETSNIMIHPDEFHRQMEYLKENGYETLVSEDIIDILNGNRKVPKKPIMITIDDGYESNYLYAYPILKELNMKATIFVIGKSIRENNHSAQPENEIPKISWEQAKEMYDSGAIDIQSHGYDLHWEAKGKEGKRSRAVITGPIVRKGSLETNDQYEARVKGDLLVNKRLIEEKVGNKVIAFAYPVGDFSESAEKLLKETDHLVTYTTIPNINKLSSDAYLLHRINIPPGHTGKSIERLINQFK